MIWAKPMLAVASWLTLIVAIPLGGLLVWGHFENSKWIINRAIDQGACSKSEGIALKHRAGPDSTRELILIDAECRNQIVRMLDADRTYQCRAAKSLFVCTHPLNAPDSSTYVRLIVAKDQAVLEVIPT